MNNDLDRFHLAGNVINRVPRLRVSGAAVKYLLRDKLTEHRLDVEKYGDNLPDVQAWRWGTTEQGRTP